MVGEGRVFLPGRSISVAALWPPFLGMVSRGQKDLMMKTKLSAAQCYTSSTPSTFTFLIMYLKRSFKYVWVQAKKNWAGKLPDCAESTKINAKFFLIVNKKARYTLLHKQPVSPHKNRACQGWSRCNGIYEYSYVRLLFTNIWPREPVSGFNFMRRFRLFGDSDYLEIQII